MADLSCPEPHQLEQLVLGRLSDRDATALEEHVESCARCLEVLHSLAREDDLTRRVRSGVRAESIVVTPLPPDLVARLCRLRGEITPPSPSALFAADLSSLLEPPQEPGEVGRLGPYRILRILGSGGMGVVHLAQQPHPHRLVALKMCLAWRGNGVSPRRRSGEHLSRFRTEIEIIARLQHPNIVPVFEAGEHDGVPYFTMEYLAGGSLAQKLAASPLAARPAAELLQTLARAVQYAHEHGVIHRDLKPSNVLLSNPSPPAPLPEAERGEKDIPSPPLRFGEGVGGRGEGGVPKITDFGLAKQLEGDPDAGEPEYCTETGAILGTPEYMAPEQAGGPGAAVGFAADVYALGAILYECLTGRPPFRAATLLETLDLIRSRDPVPPRQIAAVPADLDTICLKCLRKEPRQRYGSAGELADDLGRFLTNEPIRARPVGLWERLRKWVRRRPALATLLVVSGLSVAVLVVGGAIYNARLRQAVAEAQRHHDRADVRYRAARGTLRRMLDRMSSRRLENVPRLQELHRDLLEDSLRFYQTILEQADDPDPEVRLDAMVALVETATVQDALGRTGLARENFQRAIALLETLPEEIRARGGSQANLGVCHRYLGNQARAARQWNEGERHFRAAFAIYERLARQQPDKLDWPNELARTETLLAILYQAAGRLEEAEKSYLHSAARRARLVIAHPDNKEVAGQLAETYQNLGTIYALQKRWSEAKEVNDKALILLEPVADLQHGEFQMALAAIHVNAGDILRNMGKPAEALKRLTQAVDTAEAFLQKEPQYSLAVEIAFNAHGERAKLYEFLGRWADAVKDWDRVVAVDPYPDRWVRRYLRTVALLRAGDHARGAAEALALEAGPHVNEVVTCNLVCLYARTVAAARADDRLSLTEREQLAERYAGRAMMLLKKLHAQGYFRDKDHADALSTDEDLKALRNRPDFQKLLDQIISDIK